MTSTPRGKILTAVSLLVLLLALAVLLGRSALSLNSPTQAADFKSPAGDFTLPDQDGQVVSMQDLRGKAVVMDFIYTHCPPDEECPVLTAKFVGLQRSLKEAGLADRVVLLSITFDPERDTPQVLKDYAQQYGADLSNWHFLRGNAAQTRAVSAAYGIAYQADPDGAFEHTALMLVVDPQGMIRKWEPPDYGPGQLLADVRGVLK